MPIEALYTWKCMQDVNASSASCFRNFVSFRRNECKTPFVPHKKIGELKKWKFSFFSVEKNSIFTSFGKKFVTLYRWLQKCQNLSTMHVFDRKKPNFHFLKFPIFGYCPPFVPGVLPRSFKLPSADSLGLIFNSDILFTLMSTENNIRSGNLRDRVRGVLDQSLRNWILHIQNQFCRCHNFCLACESDQNKRDWFGLSFALLSFSLQNGSRGLRIDNMSMKKRLHQQLARELDTMTTPSIMFGWDACLVQFPVTVFICQDFKYSIANGSVDCHFFLGPASCRNRNVRTLLAEKWRHNWRWRHHKDLDTDSQWHFLITLFFCFSISLPQTLLFPSTDCMAVHNMSAPNLFKIVPSIFGRTQCLTNSCVD